MSTVKLDMGSPRIRNRTSVAGLGTAALTGAKNGRTIVQINLGVKDWAPAETGAAGHAPIQPAGLKGRRFGIVRMQA
jgi:hypothetical protein